MNFNYQYTIDPTADEPIMLIGRHIGNDEIDGQGVDGLEFMQELLTLDASGKRRIEVWINSPGGSVMEGMNIYSTILKCKAKVDTYCIGVAASIAAVIFQAGRVRCMMEQTRLMYHNPFGGDDPKGLDAIKKMLATSIAKRVNKPQQDILEKMQQTTWINAEEALREGFCDEVEAIDGANKGRLAKAAKEQDVKASWRESSFVFNSLIQQKKQLELPLDDKYKFDMTNLTKVNNRLGLMDEASIESTTKAIDNLLSEVKNKSEAEAEAKKKLEAKEAEMKKMKEDMDAEAKTAKAKYDDLETEYTKMKKSMEESEAKAKEKSMKEAKDKAAGVIAKAQNEGRLPKLDEEGLLKWVNKYETDPIGTQDLIDSLPINKTAATYNVTTTTTTAGGTVTDYTSQEDQIKHIQNIVAEKMKSVREANKRK